MIRTFEMALPQDVRILTMYIPTPLQHGEARCAPRFEGRFGPRAELFMVLQVSKTSASNYQKLTDIRLAVKDTSRAEELSNSSAAPRRLWGALLRKPVSLHDDAHAVFHGESCGRCPEASVIQEV